MELLDLLLEMMNAGEIGLLLSGGGFVESLHVTAKLLVGLGKLLDFALELVSKEWSGRTRERVG